MGQSKSSVERTSGAAAQASSQTKDAVIHRPIDRRMVQNVFLVWLDSTIDENNSDCRNTLVQLQRLVNNVYKFTDADQCIEFLKHVDEENVCMIVSGALCEKVFPFIRDVTHLHSIFIFPGTKKTHKRWIKQCSKIKGSFTGISSVCEALKRAIQECEQNTMSISIMATSNDGNKNSNQLDPSFMYMQIIKEILLEIEFEPKHFKEYINYCREVFVNNDHELENIREFEKEYQNGTSIWWYTLECFLYRMLNRALRMMDIDIIIRTGFFIKDLHQHIKQLHNEQFNGPQFREKFIVYRGQGMTKIEFEQMTKTGGGLISFNNFLSTSKDRSISLDFAKRALTSSGLVGVLFIMTIDPLQSTAPFASIKNVSAIKSEDEVLFAMQTVFRIGAIILMDKNSPLFQVELTLTRDNDKDLCQLTEHIRKENFPDEGGWYRLGSILRKIGHFDKSEEVYQILLEQIANENDRAHTYHQIGLAKYKQGQYQEAIAFYEKSLRIQQQSFPLNYSDLASSYNNIGIVYDNMNEYARALKYYEMSLEIKQQSLPPNHPDIASSYNNIGNVYCDMARYSEALLYYEISLGIQQQSFPANHPALAASCNNIGNVYDEIGEYLEAHSFYERAVKIGQQSLPVNHPDRQIYENNLNRILIQCNEYFFE